MRWTPKKAGFRYFFSGALRFEVEWFILFIIVYAIEIGAENKNTRYDMGAIQKKEYQRAGTGTAHRTIPSELRKKFRRDTVILDKMMELAKAVVAAYKQDFILNSSKNKEKVQIIYRFREIYSCCR